ncbi:MAG: hydroxymethylglutaryl-CoA lyase [Chloroflexi bacterium]|nr:hydroxymethylglutaryl-CoA lyase [Chloroflexota bacterium]MCI0646952.1 hydroxymethylglutaryl-CoA lyase [Chloroflexota bacterium]MCI0730014.1 hydroxymethylglutaryl-CoA lyase [Chloroflexota bacterium]
MPEYLKVYEVGPRDGLQNEAALISTEDKKRLVGGLVKAGLRSIEVTSFVNPKAVPQMADAGEVMRDALAKYGPAVDEPGARQFTGLVFNERGYERALAAGCRAIAIGAAVSESFSQANTGMSTQQALEMAGKLAEWARRDGVWTRAYISTAWVCPFEGPIRPEKVIAYAEKLWETGVEEMAISDTIGHASPLEVGRLMEALGRRLDMARLAVHLHDTQAMGLANTTAAIQAGVRIHDSSVAGLGGCPFAPGAAGNLATEDLVFLAFKLGLGTGVDFVALWDVVAEVEKMVGRPVGGRIRAWWESSGRLEEGVPRMSGPV